MTRRIAPYALAAGTLLIAVAAIALGSQSLAPGTIWQVVAWRLGLPGASTPDVTADQIVWMLRLPRVLLAGLTGGGLALAGVAVQAMVRNPLAEPYILGISGGASAGASLFYMGLLPPLLSRTLTLPAAAFAGSLLSIAIVYAVARSVHGLSVTRLLLSGVAVGSLMAALTSMATLASPDANRLRAVLFWLMGSFGSATWSTLPAPAIAVVASAALLYALARTLDALLLGEEPAFNLGIAVERHKRLLIVTVALLTGTLVSASGAIGFVGLVVPHAVRSLLGVTHRRLIPAAFISGALFLIAADLVARTVLPAEELPVGIVTALCGVPFFLFLLRRGNYRFG